MSRSKRKTKAISPELESQIIQEVILGKDKREIANKYKIDLGNVFSVINRNKMYITSQMEKDRISRLSSELNKDSIESIAADVIGDEKAMSDETVALKKHGRKLSDELVYQIYKDLQTGDLSRKEIAEMYEVSYNTVSKIANGKHPAQIKLINMVPSEISTNTEVDDGPIVSLDDSITTLPIIEKSEEKHSILDDRVPVIKYVRMGMIADRHNMPTTKYVFKTMDSDLMFNYDEQYRIAKNNILKYITIDKNGNASAGLFIYVTGLTCALASIIKVCQDLRIDLYLLHYNNTTKLYERQKVVNVIPSENIMMEEFDGLNFRNMYTIGCTTTEFIANGGGWEISECYFEDSKDTDISIDSLGRVTNKKSYRDLVIFTDKSKAWQYYMEVVDRNKNKNIYFSEININAGKYYKVKTISKSIQV